MIFFCIFFQLSKGIIFDSLMSNGIIFFKIIYFFQVNYFLMSNGIIFNFGLVL
jgi:hypothetical protein